MSNPTPPPSPVILPVTITSAVLVAPPSGAGKQLMRLLDLLHEVGIGVSTVDSLQDAATLLVGSDGAACAFIDTSDIVEGKAPIDDALARIKTIIDAVPGAAPVLVAAQPPPALVVAAWRAGAGDFVDLATENAAGLRKLLDRAAAAHGARAGGRRTIAALREMVEEFLRDLVKTERRSIDLEHQLAQRDRPSNVTAASAASELEENREPVVLLVEDDREVADRMVEELEEAGLVTFAFVNGEEAVKHAEKLAGRGLAIDLALVDSRLPGIDGLETIRRLRIAKPGLAAFLMTGYSDADVAAQAADLGVVGYVLKPFDDVPMLVTRIREQAALAVSRSREHHYLQRIKERHDKVLKRYRKLASEIDRG
jgi:CheY-like chemotaxis protein